MAGIIFMIVPYITDGTTLCLDHIDSNYHSITLHNPVAIWQKLYALQVQSFVGMINYLSKFLSRLSEIVKPIGKLAKDKVTFNLGPEHQSAIIHMKKEIAITPILAYYNP